MWLKSAVQVWLSAPSSSSFARPLHFSFCSSNSYQFMCVAYFYILGGKKIEMLSAGSINL